MGTDASDRVGSSFKTCDFNGAKDVCKCKCQIPSVHVNDV